MKVFSVRSVHTRTILKMCVQQSDVNYIIKLEPVRILFRAPPVILLGFCRYFNFRMS